MKNNPAKEWAKLYETMSSIRAMAEERDHSVRHLEAVRSILETRASKLHQLADQFTDRSYAHIKDQIVEVADELAATAGRIEKVYG